MVASHPHLCGANCASVMRSELLRREAAGVREGVHVGFEGRDPAGDGPWKCTTVKKMVVFIAKLQQFFDQTWCFLMFSYSGILGFLGRSPTKMVTCKPTSLGDSNGVWTRMTWAEELNCRFVQFALSFNIFQQPS